MQKNLKFLTIILVVLGALFLLKQYLPQVQKTPSGYVKKIKDLKNGSVKSIIINKNQEKVELSKEGDLWLVERKKGDKEKIEELLKSLLTEDAPELIAQTDQKHREFEVTSDTGTIITLDDKIKIILGKSVAGGGIYTRIDGDANVYLIQNISSYNLSSSPSFWMDKTIISIDRVKLKKLEFTKNKDIKTVVYKESKWINEKTGSEINKDKLEPVILALSKLTAESLVTSKSTEVYPTVSKLTLKVEFDGGSETLDFYQGKNDYKVRRLSDKEEFVITNSTAEKFVEFTPQ